MSAKVPDPIDVAVGARLKFKRQLMNVSQTKLADHLGITFQQVQKYEKGTNRISASRLLMISDFFGVVPNFFFEQVEGQTGPPGNNRSSSEEHEMVRFMSSKEGGDLNRAFARIENPLLRERVLVLVKALAQLDDNDTASEKHLLLQ
jgi:transcriptional regulator with XRE-family HTH domain